MTATFPAEARAAANTHKAWIADGCLIVHSNTTPGRKYHVVPRVLSDGVVSFTCDCEHGRRRGTQVGRPTCWHAAQVALRLRRERLTYLNPERRYAVTAKAEALGMTPPPPPRLFLVPPPADPFA